MLFKDSSPFVMKFSSNSQIIYSESIKIDEKYNQAVISLESFIYCSSFQLIYSESFRDYGKFCSDKFSFLKSSADFV